MIALAKRIAALAVLSMATVATTAAHAIPITISTHIDFSPGGVLSSSTLSGDIDIFTGINGVFQPTPPPIKVAMGPGTFDAIFSPTDPCIGDGTCQLGFSFQGLLSPDFLDQQFGTVALIGAPPGAQPNPPPIIPFALLTPTDPCTPGDPCRETATLIAYDAPIEVGTIAVTINPAAVPEPASISLFGFGLVALSASRRRRKPNC
jgi:hypothetical protein